MNLFLLIVNFILQVLTEESLQPDHNIEVMKGNFNHGSENLSNQKVNNFVDDNDIMKKNLEIKTYFNTF